MKLDAECYPCMMAQSYRAARLSGLEGESLRRALRSTASILGDLDPDVSPPGAAALFYDAIKELSGVEDPFLALKEESNRMALELLPLLREDARGYGDPFAYALRAAVAGNIIDFGARAEPGDLGENLARVLETEPFIDHGTILRRELEKARRALIICDNAGEIVFDRFLCEILLSEFPQLELTAAVRGGPAINDALLKDASEAGLPDLCKVITTGLAMAGVDLLRASRDFREALGAADVILAKGQGNFETLEGEEGNIYFLFQVKCDCVSAYLGARKGLAVIWGSQAGRTRR
ncbi:MAG: ARMT1-like domain-containing protein [Actinomycetota bacterium]|nr:ARMT1-like domain-containing protein [Actinomycetota bacterium]MDD5667199.1 ARMT1-like domain-containing protein [Actinomycetota bacterium]